MTDTQIASLTDRIIKAAQNGNTNTVDDLIQHLRTLAHQDGMNALLMDLWDGEEISQDGVEFAIENNNCKDPR